MCTVQPAYLCSSFFYLHLRWESFFWFSVGFHHTPIFFNALHQSNERHSQLSIAAIGKETGSFEIILLKKQQEVEFCTLNVCTNAMRRILVWNHWKYLSKQTQRRRHHRTQFNDTFQWYSNWWIIKAILYGKHWGYVRITECMSQCVYLRQWRVNWSQSMYFNMVFNFDWNAIRNDGQWYATWNRSVLWPYRLLSFL